MSVVFDFEGSLALARSLWAAADVVEARYSAVKLKADEALVDWHGPLSDRAASEWASYGTVSASLAAELRSDARSWASAWARAMHKQNQDRRGDHIAGEQRQHRDDPDWELPTVPDAASPPAPVPSQFAPTADPQVF